MRIQEEPERRPGGRQSPSTKTLGALKGFIRPVGVVIRPLRAL